MDLEDALGISSSVQASRPNAVPMPAGSGVSAAVADARRDAMDVSQVNPGIRFIAHPTPIVVKTVCGAVPTRDARIWAAPAVHLAQGHAYPFTASGV